MTPQLEDHLVGLELQLVELVESQQRAQIQGRPEDARRLEAEILALQAELAATAERISRAEAIEAESSPQLDASTAGDQVSAARA